MRGRLKDCRPDHPFSIKNGKYRATKNRTFRGCSLFLSVFFVPFHAHFDKLCENLYPFRLTSFLRFVCKMYLGHPFATDTRLAGDLAVRPFIRRKGSLNLSEISHSGKLKLKGMLMSSVHLTKFTDFQQGPDIMS